MNHPNLRGIFPAMVTPYQNQEDSALDEARLRELLQRLLPDVDGFVINGTTGDFPLLSREERRRTLEITAEEISGADKLLIAGTGAVATRDVITFTQDALAVGADAALVVTPYYLRPTPAGLYRHFADLAAAVPEMPILLYNFPQLAGQPIPPETVAALRADNPSIVGMKDTSGNLSYFLTVMEQTDDDFQMLVGQGTLLLPALAMGGVGGVLAAANLIPAHYQKLRAAVARGDRATARQLQSQIAPVAQVIDRYGSLGVRVGLELQGFPIGAPRSPLTLEGMLDAAERTAFEQALQACAEVS
ncbi:MAG: dihydrodipicolinate synthase family protein [Anaerolineales bacterium]